MIQAPDETFGSMIWTAKSQLQINDGFYVHESANLAQTIVYLAQRTKIMTELHEVRATFSIMSLADISALLALDSRSLRRPKEDRHPTRLATPSAAPAFNSTFDYLSHDLLFLRIT